MIIGMERENEEFPIIGRERALVGALSEANPVRADRNVARMAFLLVVVLTVDVAVLVGADGLS